MKSTLWLVSLSVSCSMLDCEYQKEYPLFAIPAGENENELDAYVQYFNTLVNDICNKDVDLPNTVAKYSLFICVDELKILSSDGIQPTKVQVHGYEVDGIDTSNFDDTEVRTCIKNTIKWLFD